jgi:hypothetical protein
MYRSCLRKELYFRILGVFFKILDNKILSDSLVGKKDDVKSSANTNSLDNSNVTYPKNGIILNNKKE